MEKTPSGTAVGVDDPYEFVGRCDHLTSDGRCWLAFESPDADPEFAAERRAADYECVLAESEEDPDWGECPQFRCRNRDRECVRCGLTEARVAHSNERPLLEEHHLSYRDGEETSHEITVYLCRWCHAKVHKSWARITDDVAPDPEAIAERETRRGREQAELTFESAAERFDTRSTGTEAADSRDDA